MPDRKLNRQTILDRMPRVGGRWYSISNQSAQKATIRIYDEIGFWGVTEEEFASDLDAITSDEIEVQISSPGGDVFAGIAILNALRSHPARVTTRVDGIAASVASVVVQAGDHRVMLSGSQMMVHEAWGLVIGAAAEMREFADLLDKQTQILADIYAERSGRDRDEVLALISDETWMTATEAVEAGLADEVVTPARQSTNGDGGDPENQGRRLSEHLVSVITEAEALTERVAELSALRADQGKPIDDGWRTRPEVDRLAAALANLQEALTASPNETDTDELMRKALQREYARFVEITQGV